MTAFSTLAQYRMDNGDHMDSGWGWAMFVAMLLVALAVIALVVWLVRTNSATRPHPAPGLGEQTPLQILDRRLAAGEITPEEYRERASILRERS